jgi:hypothetical protein
MNPAHTPATATPAVAAPAAVATAGRWNTLLYWMSDTGEGSWDRFRNVITELANDDGDLGQLRRTLRVRLSDFGHADFFIGGSSRWKALPPLAAGLMGPTEAALLIGARTPKLLASVRAATAEHGVHISDEALDDSPNVIRLEGPAEALNACAFAAGIDYADSYARRLAATLLPIPLLLDRPRRDTDCTPINWTARSYDLQSYEWVDGALPNSACEFTPRYGRPRYFVSNRRRRLLEVVGRRDAVYAAAYAKGISLATHDTATRTLSVPASAPLPEAYARVACLCSGRRADVAQGQIVYSGVHPEIGAVLLTALGHPRAIIPLTDGAQER